MPTSTISALIKPASSLCNLRCRYCFYADVSEHREIASYGIMSSETAHTLIDRMFARLSEAGHVQFTFQGGEPTLAGLDFFRDFCDYAAEKNTRGHEISYAIQTNGMLLDDAFCAFLAEHNFLVGLSLDGDELTHDRNRVDAAGKGTHRRLMQTVARMRRHGVEFNILAVVTESMAKHPTATFRFFMKNGMDYLQFIPCLRSLEEDAGTVPPTDAPYVLSARTYSDFLVTLFHLWRAEIERGHGVSIRLFDNVMGMYLGQMPEQCGLYGMCHNQLVVEADGSVYPCDFYVLDDYRMGNITRDSLDTIENSEAGKCFAAENPPKNPRCAACRYLSMCAGTCKRYRPFYASVPDFCPYESFLDRVQGDIAALLRRFKG